MEGKGLLYWMLVGVYYGAFFLIAQAVSNFRVKCNHSTKGNKLDVDHFEIKPTPMESVGSLRCFFRIFVGDVNKTNVICTA